MKINFVHVCLLLAVMLSSVAAGQEYGVEVIDATPEADAVSDEVAKQIADKGIRVKKGSTRTLCEIWFCKQLAVESDFKASEDRLYPFTPGQLIGLLHFGRRGSEFRDQTVSSGWYTLRFALQPIDGNHEGTSPTRDFLLLVDAEQDEFADNWEVEALHEVSAEAAGSTHPAMLCLQRVGEESPLAVRHDEANDWWILHAAVEGIAGKETKNIPLALVVAGHAAE